MPVAILFHETDLMALLGEPQVCIVLAENQTVFAAAGHHAVGFIGALGDQVVHQGADVGFVAGEDEWLFALDLERRIDACHEALGGGFLVAAGAVGLTGGVEAGDLFHFQRRIELQGIQKVVLDGVGRAHELHVLEARDGAEKRILHVDRHGCRHALHVHFIRIQALGFYEKLVSFLISEANHLILDGRAVPRADAVNLAGVLRRPHEIFADDAVGFLIGVGEPAVSLISIFPLVHEGEGVVHGVAALQLHVVQVEAADVHAARGAGLETENLEPVLLQIFRQSHRGAHAIGPAGVHVVADDDLAVQVRAGGKDHRLAAVFFAKLGGDAHAAAVLYEDVHHLHLGEVQIFCILHHFFHIAVVFILVRLGAQRIHRRAFAQVQHAHLDGRRVGSDAHLAA